MWTFVIAVGSFYAGVFIMGIMSARAYEKGYKDAIRQIERSEYVD